MHLDESDFNNFWKFIQKHQLFSVIDSEASNQGMRTTAYINNQLGNKELNNVKNIYSAWVSQGKPRRMSSKVTPVFRVPSSRRGTGITKRKKKRKPRKNKSVKKRKGKSKKKRVRRGRKTKRRS